MASRPRKYKDNVENLYQKTDKRNGKTYYTYKNPESGKFHGLGSDRDAAFAAATKANQIFAERKLDQLRRILEHDTGMVKITSISAKMWAQQYIKLQKIRLDDNEIKQATYENNVYRAKFFAKRFGNSGLKELSVKDIASVLDELKSEGKKSFAEKLRSTWIDMFNEAQRAGEVDTGFNPAQITRPIKPTVSRERITKEDMTLMMRSKKYQSDHLNQILFKLAITTGLRGADLRKLKFKDMKESHLFVELSKSNGKVKLAFPLTLTNPFLGESLGDIIKQCRETNIASQYMLHMNRKGHKGKPCSADAITRRFLAVKRSCPEIADKNISLHEIRSFAARTYKEAGYDIQTLLGHKSSDMTERYEDDRLDSYKFITAPEQKSALQSK
ncbi:phage integrase Arm DNA-binding domain-containing protein [Vibrio sp. PNB22_4_2]